MKNLIVLLAMFVVGISFTNLHADEVGMVGSASVDIMSNYVWRGQKLSSSWVVQPSAGITYGSFGFNLWANYDSDSKIDEGDNHGEFTETDLTLNYSYAVDKLAFGAGYIYYALNGANDTQEIYISASYGTILNPTIVLYYDYDKGDGAFVVASIGHSLEISKDMPLNLGASASYNIRNKIMGFDNEGKRFSNFYNGEVFASLNVPVYKNVTLSPKAAYSFPLSSDAKAAIKSLSDDNKESIFYGGINITLSF